MTFDAEQLANAATIINVGKSLDASPRDLQIALMAAMQESSLRNLDYGDRDSVGLFQQRNAWGEFAQRHDPEQAARMFFTGGHGGQRGLFDITDRERMSLAEAAQAVQVSAYPDAYTKWSDEAADLLRDSDLAAFAGDDGTDGGDDPYITPDPPDISAEDSDHDGLTDEFERLLHTDSHDDDSDDDGLSDLEETTVTHTDPLSTDPGVVALPQTAVDAGFGGAGTLDRDHDGLSDLTEARIGSDPTRVDSDLDDVSDNVEARLGSSPVSIDTDQDGLVDSQELDVGTLAGAPVDPGQDITDGQAVDESTS